MQNHQKNNNESTKIIALRVPKATHVILLERSKDWKMSVSSLLRELVIKVFNDNNAEEMNRIKSYRKREFENDKYRH